MYDTSTKQHVCDDCHNPVPHDAHMALPACIMNASETVHFHDLIPTPFAFCDECFRDYTRTPREEQAFMDTLHDAIRDVALMN
jgi:hypothetical protein